jgi:hypothetical protein
MSDREKVRPVGGDHPERETAFVAAFVCDSLAQWGRGSAGDPRDAGACQSRDHADLHQRGAKPAAGAAWPFSSTKSHASLMNLAFELQSILARGAAAGGRLRN